MPFFAYTINAGRFVRHSDSQLILCGKHGVLTRCAAPKVPQGGKWRVTEQELLSSLELPGGAEAYALVDDLVPRGPEVNLARVHEVRGYLEETDSTDDAERYNPILFTMEEIFYLNPEEAPKSETEREALKLSIPVPRTPGKRIRSLGYLLKSWQPSRGFQGAFLQDHHWNFFSSEIR